MGKGLHVHECTLSYRIETVSLGIRLLPCCTKRRVEITDRLLPGIAGNGV